ncbi:MFS transporter [Acinetobacter sp.]|jgi:MFS family permease|uniref:MFS transporter n=1 Tax=Acinetobacter sp. TaxID=472 RepID=UPI002834138D|nr:MFS transporter [Acinetobacter sp.]MDR2248525.1 MFS transporter [Acinetobacter sp.]
MNQKTAVEQSWSALLRGSNGLKSIALAGGVALHAINIYVVTTILPTIINEIGGLEFYAWNTTLFVIASIVGSALASKLLEQTQPKTAYLIALGVFSLGSIVCAMATSMPFLLLGRAIQGFGGGILFALSYALIRIVFTQNLWSRAMALVSAMWGIATLVGPAIGGIFAQLGNWRLAFGILLPISLILAFIVIIQFKFTEKSNNSTKIPYLSIGLLVLSVLSVSIGSLSLKIEYNLLGIIISLFLIVLISKIDNKAKNKLLPTGSYSLSSQLGVLYGLMCLLVAALTTEIYVPYFLQIINNFSPLTAGYMTAMMAGGWTLAAIFSAGRSEQTIYKFIRFSPLVILIALVLLAILTYQAAWSNSALGIIIYCMALASVGFGIGLAWPHILTRVFSAANSGEETLASSSITTIQLYATALSAALAGIIANLGGFTSPGGIEGARSAALFLFLGFVIAPLLALILSTKVKK